MKYIGLGNWNKYNIYILIAFLADILIDSLTGLNTSNTEKPARIFPFKAKIRNHNLLYIFINLASILFGGVFLYYFGERNEKEKNDKTIIKNYEIVKEYTLNDRSGPMTSNIILIGAIFSLYWIFEAFIDFSAISFWPLEIFYIGIISYLVFKHKIYIHKKVAIALMVVVAIVNVIEYFIPMTEHKNLDNTNELKDKNIFERAIIKYGAFSIPLYYLANELKHIQRDYCWIKSKYLMDVKSVEPYKIFLSIGSIGVILVIILISIFSFVPCKTFNNVNKKGNNYFYNNTNDTLKLYLEYCSLSDYDENSKELRLFYDSIKLISRDYSNTDKDNMLEIFVLIPLLFLFLLVNKVSRLMLVRYTDPTNILVYRYFYYFMKRLIQFIINEGNEQYLTYTKFFITQLEELLGIFNSLIFNELLELKFCGLDYELKKNIDRRGSEDIIKGLEIDNDSVNDKNDNIELIGIDDQEIYE